MKVARYKYVVLVVVLALVLGFVLLRQWQGPLLQGYRIEPAALVQTVVATGRVVTVSRAQVGSEITGVVLERRVREGDTVAAGAVLLVLRSDDLAAQVRQAEAELAQLASTTRPQAMVALASAESQLAQATRETERRRTLANQRLLSSESLEQAVQSETLARSAAAAARLTAASLAQGKSEETVLQERLQSLKAQLAKTIVRAEKAGTILTRNVEPGDLVQPGRVLFTMALAGDTEVLVPLDEKNLALLSLQQPALALADAYLAQPFPAVISFIAPAIDPQRGTVDVRLKVDPVPAFLRQDMTVSVNIETGRRQQALVIPNDALSGVQGNVAQVMVIQAGKAQQQQVTLGLRGLTQSEVLSGLQAGDVVIADAAVKIAAGSRVRSAEQPLPVAGSPGTSATHNELPVNFN